MTANFDPRELRVSDAERTHVVSVLQKAIGHGMLNLDEFTARTDRALAAKTRAELNVLLVDLPGVTHRDSDSPLRPRPERINAVMASIHRDGQWRVPRDLLITNRLGSTDLDFSEAIIEHAEVNIELRVSGGSVTILLPERGSVDAQQVTIAAGGLKDKVGVRGGGRPHFVLSGTVTAGSLHLRRASYNRIGRLVIRSPWKLSWDNSD
ncbi:DUF1707 SHOCT-like domain-containing protein [Actinophytocola gossypii]|uniref:DUF1707 and DUF2154 domain-containing protein n=1 Tax=Actinophytocola gossypii TaxID=2812003 RepID=A0ABT2JF48_9PSEU|nr:DUF1707 domain-containing protein [Actinophytocola gossypii]MCT2586500.1 DUF1707 and DUF2154 domain-containing protein [Actinophytocola gossypii]